MISSIKKLSFPEYDVLRSISVIMGGGENDLFMDWFCSDSDYESFNLPFIIILYIILWR